jgi:hypothetical protein
LSNEDFVGLVNQIVRLDEQRELTTHEPDEHLMRGLDEVCKKVNDDKHHRMVADLEPTYTAAFYNM